jgi:hypothetical protein
MANVHAQERCLEASGRGLKCLLAMVTPKGCFDGPCGRFLRGYGNGNWRFPRVLEMLKKSENFQI